MLLFFNNSPQKQYVKSTKKIAKLAKKRNKISCWDINAKAKTDKLNAKMHIEYSKKEVALEQIRHPASNDVTISPTFNIGKNVNDRSIQAHYHNHSKKKK